MAAYVILDIDVKDPDGYEEYKKQGAPTIATYGGKPLIRGEKIESLEGNWNPKRLVAVEFDSYEIPLTIIFNYLAMQNAT